MAQIEYKVLQYPEGITQKTEKEWNKLGKEGWDLVSFGPTVLDVTGSVEDSMSGFTYGDTKGQFTCLTAVFKRIKND